MTESAIKFPCDFPIKVLGKANENFELAVLEIFRKLVPEISENSLKQRTSQQGKYLALTVTVRAESQDQLDNIYRALSSCPEVVMAL